MERENRKMDHLNYVGKQTLSDARFSDIHLIHNCLPEMALNEVDFSTEAAGMKLAAPVFINAITGGTGETISINKKLALIAKRLNMAIAVGSQAAALNDSSLEDSYKVVREVYPNGIIIANVGAGTSVKQAQKAVAMISADALQLHLNVPQELFMVEGDRSFYYLDNIKAIAANLDVPVIAKEVGFGMAAEQIKILLSLGIAAVDVGGFGGTNFIDIENNRSGNKNVIGPGIINWGNPTPASIAEAASIEGVLPDFIIASGGINNALDIVKALALGSSAVGMAAYPLALLQKTGVEKTVKELEIQLEQIRIIMSMLGCRSILDLHRIPLIICGETYHWLKLRGLNLEKFATR